MEAGDGTVPVLPLQAVFAGTRCLPRVEMQARSELEFKQAELHSCPVPLPLLSHALPKCCHLDDFKPLGEVWNKVCWVPAKTNRYQACKSTVM